MELIRYEETKMTKKINAMEDELKMLKKVLDMRTDGRQKKSGIVSSRDGM